MRLLSDNMAVPEINGAVANSNALIKKETLAVAHEGDSIESRNLQLAKQVEAHKNDLIKALAKFPAAALWLCNKHEQNNDNHELEDEKLPASEFDGSLKDLKEYYKLAKQSFSESEGRDVSAIAKRRLMLAVQQFPLVFDDLVKLVDLIVYAFNDRGISYKPLYASDDTQVQKQAGIITKRLEAVSQSGNASTAGQFKAMVLDASEGSFLFLSIAEMSQLLPEVVLAEHSWLEYRRQLATANTKLVLFIANQYKGSFLDFDDLVQEGHSGLLKAVDRFKYHLGFQFSTYAGYWIRQAISRALSRSERVVRIPCGQIATINKI